MRTLLLSTTLLALAGCTASTAAPSAAPTRSAPPAATPSPTTPSAAALGAARTVATQEWAVSVTAYAYRQPLPSRFPPDRKGYVYAGADIRTCLTKGADGTVSWHPWRLTYADDTMIEPVGSWSDDWFRVPLYPGFDQSLRTGRCVRGWALFEVPKGKRPTGITYEPTYDDGTPMPGLQWATR